MSAKTFKSEGTGCIWVRGLRKFWITNVIHSKVSLLLLSKIWFWKMVNNLVSAAATFHTGLGITQLLLFLRIAEGDAYNLLDRNV